MIQNFQKKIVKFEAVGGNIEKKSLKKDRASPNYVGRVKSNSNYEVIF